MTEDLTCVFCGSEKVKGLKRFSTVKLSKCSDCHMVFSSQRPSMQELLDYYAIYSRNDYRSDITTYRYRSLLGSFESERKLNNLLDVGCGTGYFLEEVLNGSWNTFGTEFSEVAVNMCEEKGIQMFLGSLEEINFKDLKFDVVTSFEVIEHLSNPVVHVEKMCEILRPGGLVYITTPNFNSLNRRLLREKWNVISYPEHLNYFTKKSLHHLMVSKGFVKVNLVTDGISPGRLISSIQRTTVDHASANTKDEVLRRKIEEGRFLQLAKSAANAMLNLTGLGESLKATYRKL